MDKAIGFRIPKSKEKVWDEFLQLLEDKYGKKKGMVSMVIIQLVEQFIRANKEGGIDPLQISMHTCAKSDFPNLSTENSVKRRYKSLNTSNNGDVKASKFDQEIEEIKRRIMERFPDGATSISKQLIYGIIGNVCKVTDKRSIKARAAILVSQGFLVDLGGTFFAIPRYGNSAVKSSVSNNGNGSYEEEQGYERIIHLKEANPVKDGYNGY
jgi:hypothetical protein